MRKLPSYMGVLLIFIVSCTNGKKAYDDRAFTVSKKDIRAIYIGTCFDIEKITKLVESFGANAVIIDMKDDKGEITCDLGITSENKQSDKIIPDITSLLSALKKNEIYTIARIVAFKDSLRTEMCIKDSMGSVWVDKEKTKWLNPYNKKVWKYLKNISKASVKAGFDEIQFDYIRFSSYLKGNEFDSLASSISRKDIINRFLDYVVKRIHTYGASVSVDVFGCIIDGTTDTPTNKNTAARSVDILGQDYLEIAKRADYICPMIYPSHYPKWAPSGIENPDLEPYKVVRIVMEASNKMLKNIINQKKIAIVRPYLQAFTARWLKTHQKYERKHINEQIKAVSDSGLKQWALFNFSIAYP